MRGPWVQILPLPNFFFRGNSEEKEFHPTVWSFTFAYPLHNSPDSKIYIIRFPDIQISEDKFRTTISGPLLQTKYSYKITDSQAPQVTNCVTAIRYLLEQATNGALANIFIGDMPRILVTLCGLSIHQIRISEMEQGDLIFLKRDSGNKVHLEKRYITHVAIATGKSMIFHSSSKRGRGEVENLVMPKDMYAKGMVARVIDEPSLFLSYIDPRNHKLRDHFESPFLPLKIFRFYGENGSSEEEMENLSPVHLSES